MKKFTFSLTLAAFSVFLFWSFSNAEAAALDDYDVGSEEEILLRDYLADLQRYLGRAREKRTHFCLKRDMTCPKLDNGKDFCCRNSQCSCNLFGQNCKCNRLGLFQRLG